MESRPIIRDLENLFKRGNEVKMGPLSERIYKFAIIVFYLVEIPDENGKTRGLQLIELMSHGRCYHEL